MYSTQVAVKVLRVFSQDEDVDAKIHKVSIEVTLETMA